MKKRIREPYAIATDVFLCLIMAYLLVFGERGLHGLSLVKRNTYYRLCTLYVLSVFVIALVRFSCRKASFSDLGHFFKDTSWTQRLIGVYLGFTVVSAILSPYQDAVWLGVSRYEGVVIISCYCVSFFLISSFARPREWLLIPFSLVVMAFCLICHLQYLGYNPFSLYAERILPRDRESFVGTIGNIDFVATFLCIAMPIFWASILRLKSRLRFALVLPLAMCLALLLRMDVSSGLFGVFGSAFLGLSFVVPVKASLRKWLVLAMLYLLLMGLVLVWWRDFSNILLHEAHEILNGRIDDSFGNNRIRIWRGVWARAKEQPWFGHGPDTMVFYRIRERAQFPNKLPRGPIADAAHNEYLNILFHQGALALAAYLGALGVALKKWLSTSAHSALAAILGVAVLSYLLQAFFNISQQNTAPFFWCVFGLLDRSLRKKRQA